jgi:hypothetical protein
MKRLSFLLTIVTVLGFSSYSYAQGVPYHDIVLSNASGNARPVPSAVITVCATSNLSIPCSVPLPNALFKDYALAQPLTNPFNADVNGNFQFFIAPGNYTVTTTGIGYTGFSYQLNVGGSGGGGGGTNNQTLQNNGVALPGRPFFNLISGTGALVTCADNPGLTRSDCTFVGSIPGAPFGSLQFNNGGLLAGTPGITTPDNGNSIDITGPIPWVDTTNFGVRPLAYPANTITVTTSASSPTVTTTGVSDFHVNDGIAIPGAGNATAQSTPAAPTVTVIGIAGGAGTINYQCVGVDKQWGLTAASPSGTTTSAPLVFGAVAVGISTISRTTNVVTVTTSSTMPFSSGTLHAVIANVTGGTTQFSGPAQLVTVTSGTTLTFAQTGANESGTVTASSYVLFKNSFQLTSVQSTAGSNQIVLTTDVNHNIQFNNSGTRPVKIFLDGINFAGATPPGYANGLFGVAGVTANTITVTTQYTSPVTATATASLSLATSGVAQMSATVYPVIDVTCPALSGTTKYYAIYANYGSGFAPIGFTIWGTNFFEDYGPAFTKAGFVPPPAMNLPATPPGAAQRQIFSGQIAPNGISGSTLTLTSNVPAAVAGVTAYHDNGVPFQNAIASSCQSSGGVGLNIEGFASVYLPRPSLGGSYWYIFNAPTDLSATCNRISVIDGGRVYLDGTLSADNAGFLNWITPHDLAGLDNFAAGAVSGLQVLAYGHASPEMVTPPSGGARVAGMQFNTVSNGEVGLLNQAQNTWLWDNSFLTSGNPGITSIPLVYVNNFFENHITNTTTSGSVNFMFPIVQAGAPPLGEVAFWPIPTIELLGPQIPYFIMDGLNYFNDRGIQIDMINGNSGSPAQMSISDVGTYQSPLNPLVTIYGDGAGGILRLDLKRTVTDSVLQPNVSCISSDSGKCIGIYTTDTIGGASTSTPTYTGAPSLSVFEYLNTGGAPAQNTNECSYSPVGIFNCSMPINAKAIAVGTSPPSTVCGTATGVLCLGESSIACTPTVGQDCIHADSVSHELLATINGSPELPLVQTTGTSVDLTGQTAAIGATNIVASAPRNGIYRICFSSNITTAGSVSSTLGGTNGFQVIYTSPTDLSSNTTVPNAAWSSTANTTATAVGGCVSVYALASTSIQYSFGYTSNAANTMAYEIHVRAEDGLN